jgi:hypothetical protein
MLMLIGLGIGFARHLRERQSPRPVVARGAEA